MSRDASFNKRVLRSSREQMISSAMGGGGLLSSVMGGGMGGGMGGARGSRRPSSILPDSSDDDDDDDESLPFRRPRSVRASREPTSSPREVPRSVVGLTGGGLTGGLTGGPLAGGLTGGMTGGLGSGSSSGAPSASHSPMGRVPSYGASLHNGHSHPASPGAVPTNSESPTNQAMRPPPIAARTSTLRRQHGAAVRPSSPCSHASSPLAWASSTSPQEPGQQQD
jgi:hypothetical protein